MILVVDSSFIVAALVDSGSVGRWAETVLRAAAPVSPYLLPVEVTNILRRAELTGDLSKEISSLVYSDFLDLRVDLFPFEPFAERIWSLRSNLTAYDAWYVALAESLKVMLATLDRRLARASGTECEFLLPEG